MTDDIAAVRAWSRKIHGDGARHDWCIQTARAMLDGTELPHQRGYSKGDFSTGDRRRDTIRRLLKLEAT